MAEHTEDSGLASESVMDKITEKKLHGHHDSSSSSDSDNEKPNPSPSPSPIKTVNRLFGRERPVHQVFGGGKRADMFLWRNKKISASMLIGVTLVWILFELVDYHLLTLICHGLILTLAILFVWSNASKFIHKSPPLIPDISIPEEPLIKFVTALRIDINQALTLLRDAATGRDLKKFLAVIAGLWVLSIVGSWCNFLTLIFIGFLLLHTVPVIYEKYDNQVDSFAEKAMAEIKKQYAVFDAKVLSKIPKGPFKDKKRA